MGDISFKKAEIDDLPELYSFGEKIFIRENRYFDKWNPENISDLFMDNNAVMIIAKRGKKILGIAAGKISEADSGIMELIWFGVPEKFSGTGFAEDLLNVFIDTARESGINSVRIKVDSNSEKFLPADFNKIGFVETGIIRVLDLKF